VILPPLFEPGRDVVQLFPNVLSLTWFFIVPMVVDVLSFEAIDPMLRGFSEIVFSFCARESQDKFVQLLVELFPRVGCSFAIDGSKARRLGTTRGSDSVL